MLNLKNLNSNVNSEYDVKNLGFKKIYEESHEDLGVNLDAKLFYSALNIRSFRRIYHVKLDSFLEILENFVNVCNNRLRYNKTYHEQFGQRKITPLAKNKLNEISLHIRNMVLKYFKRNFAYLRENLNKEECKEDLTVAIYFNHMAENRLVFPDHIFKSIVQNLKPKKSGINNIFVHDFGAKRKKKML
ncbi:hypothetical protein EDEG_00959 [Edhazardia aedis USNM 41457]|uniref:Uncharacterized protein n=1 Tax=Edhazardia aedis (strain USNM 41457) TaxID=1003232 RepID=J9DAS7_EDHAE|nr:hypothetical protein EDEG_00959 [Edhazardia aedis USNM 41457]|eukprot:EJW04866.1 hypothetical protein EDEG_00959 [Edhazardia aedis USNM 41457]